MAFLFRAARPCPPAATPPLSDTVTRPRGKASLAGDIF